MKQDVKELAREILSEPMTERLRVLRHTSVSIWNTPRCTINRLRIKELVAQNPRLHLGCGPVRLPGFVNLDYRPTAGADLAMDCTDLAPLGKEVVELIYSNAFFEHLFKADGASCLSSCYVALQTNGTLVFSGIPDFESLAVAYLTKKPGITTNVFDLSQVYRYTHGNPEEAHGWWAGQLHKSLFDASSVTESLLESGFRDFVIFRYAFRDEPVALNLAWVARKGGALTKEDALEQLLALNQDVNPLGVEVLVS